MAKKLMRQELTFFSAKFPELSAVGQPSDFYVFDYKRLPYCWSGRITSSKGSQAYWHKLSEARKRSDKKEFQKLVDEIFEMFPKELMK